jgi:hypothetical protein
MVTHLALCDRAANATGPLPAMGRGTNHLATNVLSILLGRTPSGTYSLFQHGHVPGQSNCLLWTLFLPKTSLLSFVGIALVCFAIPWFYIMLMQERAVNTFKALCSLAAMRICNVIFPKHLQLKRL